MGKSMAKGNGKRISVSVLLKGDHIKVYRKSRTENLCHVESKLLLTLGKQSFLINLILLIQRETLRFLKSGCIKSINFIQTL